MTIYHTLITRVGSPSTSLCLPLRLFLSSPFHEQAMLQPFSSSATLPDISSGLCLTSDAASAALPDHYPNQAFDSSNVGSYSPPLSQAPTSVQSNNSDALAGSSQVDEKAESIKMDEISHVPLSQVNLEASEESSSTDSLIQDTRSTTTEARNQPPIIPEITLESVVEPALPTQDQGVSIDILPASQSDPVEIDDKGASDSELLPTPLSDFTLEILPSGLETLPSGLETLPSDLDSKLDRASPTQDAGNSCHSNLLDSQSDALTIIEPTSTASEDQEVNVSSHVGLILYSIAALVLFLTLLVVIVKPFSLNHSTARASSTGMLRNSHTAIFSPGDMTGPLTLQLPLF